MRFGVIAMQMDSLIPPGMNSEDFLAHIMNFDLSKIVEQITEFGFDLFELSGDLALFLPHTFEPESIEKLRNLKEEQGLTFTMHLPLWSIEPSTPSLSVRKGSVDAITNCIRAVEQLEPEIYVLHATGALAAEIYRIPLPELANTYLLRQFQNNARESLLRILYETGISSRRLAIETIEFPFDLTLELAEELELSICLDTGHVLVGFSGPIGIFEALELCLPFLGEIHLHDGRWQGLNRNIGYGKDHQALGRGDLDVGRFLDELDVAAFNGPVIFELDLENALESIEYIRSIRPEKISK
jgi:sugar phosphate isomerase/epimerase